MCKQQRHLCNNFNTTNSPAILIKRQNVAFILNTCHTVRVLMSGSKHFVWLIGGLAALLCMLGSVVPKQWHHHLSCETKQLFGGAWKQKKTARLTNHLQGTPREQQLLPQREDHFSWDQLSVKHSLLVLWDRPPYASFVGSIFLPLSLRHSVKRKYS